MAAAPVAATPVASCVGSCYLYLALLLEEEKGKGGPVSGTHPRAIYLLRGNNSSETPEGITSERRDSSKQARG